MLQTLLGMILGGSFLAFLQFLIERKDKKKDELGEIKKAIEDLRSCIKRVDEKADRREAEARRIRILRFEEELQRDVRHTKEAFDQIMEMDITEYERYCDTHPGYKNNRAGASIEHIQNVYSERLDKHDFLVIGEEPE